MSSHRRNVRPARPRHGRRFAYEDAVAIPLPHPSGASGWLNDPANRALVAEAAALVREELNRAGRTSAVSPPVTRRRTGTDT